MLLNDFSQLAVLNGPRNLRGAVTWQSIAHARHAAAGAKLTDAINPDAVAVRYDKELVDVLPEPQRTGFVVVRDQENVAAFAGSSPGTSVSIRSRCSAGARSAASPSRIRPPAGTIDRLRQLNGLLRQYGERP